LPEKRAIPNEWYHTLQAQMSIIRVVNFHYSWNIVESGVKCHHIYTYKFKKKTLICSLSKYLLNSCDWNKYIMCKNKSF
jgi:hypothetical protein